MANQCLANSKQLDSVTITASVSPGSFENVFIIHNRTTMRKFALQQYKSMQHDIVTCHKNGLDEEKKSNAAFTYVAGTGGSCRKYYSYTILQMKRKRLIFLKHKLFLTSEIEYYNLMYHA